MSTFTTLDQQTMEAIPEKERAIEVSDLVKHYPNAPVNAVDSISFRVKRGEIFGLLGPNGAGKTTTIGVLTTSVRPTSGTARIMGIDVATDPMAVKQRIAVVPQQSNLDRSLRAREILTFHASYHGMARAERNQRADALLEELGLGDRGKDAVLHYSGGMAQRLMLARALMHSPDVLFLDEPTNSLDPQSRLFLWDRIRTLKEQGVTILLTTHDMEEADQLCERIAIMDKGHILVLNTSEELKKIVPGGTRLELSVRVPEHAAMGASSATSSSSAVLEALRAIPGATKVEEVPTNENEAGGQDIEVFRLYAEDANGLISSAIQAVAETGAELRDLHLARPSLEDVFIYLTGRNLR
ncbi:MAG: ATP-binding cassette domain-containing protein [Chloroflexota bacterium]|nr:ATP-binding cassette domain-containing protein [Chloroflexota bacterium]